MEPGRILSARRTAAQLLTPAETLARALDPEWLRAALAAPDPPDAARHHAESAAAWTDGAEPGTLAEAAVLVGITTGDTPGVLLTRRSPHLRRHAGQVSFPGGRIDPTDASPEHAALREAQEEIGLAPADVALVGRLAPYVTGTGYRITPVVGLVRAHTPLLAPEEVTAAFELPLATLLDPSAPEQRTAMFGGRERRYWVWPHPEHDIWGATAAILVHLARCLRHEIS